MEQETAVRVKITGRVQGVCFRAFTRDTAAGLRLSGYVRNCTDGTVECLFQGPKEEVAAMIQRCWEGPPLSQVDQVAQSHIPLDSYLQGFQIRY